MKATEQYVRVVLFYAVKMKANEQYFPVLMFTLMYKVVLTFDSVN